MLRRVLSIARDEVRHWNGEMIFVYVPSWEAFDEGSDRFTGKGSDIRRHVLHMVDELKIPVIDLQAPMAADPDWKRYFYFPGSHFSEAGYARAGSLILGFLEQKRPDLFASVKTSSDVGQ
jgi:hypothetical protein